MASRDGLSPLSVPIPVLLAGVVNSTVTLSAYLTESLARGRCHSLSARMLSLFTAWIYSAATLGNRREAYIATPNRPDVPPSMNSISTAGPVVAAGPVESMGPGVMSSEPPADPAQPRHCHPRGAKTPLGVAPLS